MVTLRIGDQVKYWGGLGGSVLADGKVCRIELAPEVLAEAESLEAEALVDELELTEANGGSFVDIEGGSWTYAARIIEVNGVKV